MLRERLIAAWDRIKGWITALHLSTTWPLILEIVIIYLWAAWMGRVYLNMSAEFMPVGGDYTLQIESHYVWKLLPECGTCFFWNGTMNGGAPSFAELRGAFLHPVVIFTTFLWGVVNGSKVAMIISLFLAGLAQWWLARTMELGRLPRMWAALMAVAGGHLAGRMEDGLTTMVLSIATTSLVLAPLVSLLFHGRKRSVIWLGVMVAMSLLSGQAYIQLALIFGILPASLVFFTNKTARQEKRWIPLLLGLGMGVLLAGVLIVPALHFWPNFTKDSDVTLQSAQSLANMPLNLLIGDMDYFRVEQMGHIPAPFVYVLYIGWIPILLSVAAMRLAPREKSGLLAFFIVGVVLLFVISSREVLHSLLKYIPQLMFIRFPALLTTMTVPLIIGLGAWGLDLLMKLNWSRIELHTGSGVIFRLSMIWLVITLPLIAGLYSVVKVNRGWYQVDRFPLPQSVLQALETESTQWVSPPYGEFLWKTEMLEKGYKLTGLIRTWGWKGRSDPLAYRLAQRPEEGKDFGNVVFQGEGVIVSQNEAGQYARITAGEEQIPCVASTRGGFIDVACSTEGDGLLVVREFYYTGWKAWLDGEPVHLDSTASWLTVDAPAGKHTYTFRYQPWDVWVGLIFTLAGVVLGITLHRRWGYESQADSPQ